VMQIETQIPKNKVFKTQVLKTYLTLIFKSPKINDSWLLASNSYPRL
jgi:hypothetical protein